MELAKGSLKILLSLALAFLLSFAACTGSRTNVTGNRVQNPNEGGHTWCIAKPSSYMDGLLYNIDYSCSQAHVDCSHIQMGGSCFHPRNMVSHASFAMNLFYRASGKHPWNCHFNGTGLIVSQDPSFGSCLYPI